MVTVPQAERIILLGSLKARCRELGITHDRIAKAAKVTRPLVVNVFAARKTSRNVVETAQRLVVQAERRRGRKSA
jgi:hypothetical protein